MLTRMCALVHMLQKLVTSFKTDKIRRTEKSYKYSSLQPCSIISKISKTLTFLSNDILEGPLIKHSVFDAFFGVLSSLLLLAGVKTRSPGKIPDVKVT